jgi:hypothetical protein
MKFKNEYEEVLDTIEKIILNIINNPGEEMYLTISSVIITNIIL